MVIWPKNLRNTPLIAIVISLILILIMGNFTSYKVDPDIVEAIDFMVEKVSNFCNIN